MKVADRVLDPRKDNLPQYNTNMAAAFVAAAKSAQEVKK